MKLQFTQVQKHFLQHEQNTNYHLYSGMSSDQLLFRILELQHYKSITFIEDDTEGIYVM